MDDPFYLPLGNDRWRATVHTTGPWDARFQHGGPPSALLARAIEQCSPRDDMLIARMTVDILGAIPVDELELRSRMLRPGRSVELVEATLSAGGREVARAQAWRVLRATQKIAPRQTPAPTTPSLRAESTSSAADGWVDGYLSAVEWRFTAGAFGQRHQRRAGPDQVALHQPRTHCAPAPRGRRRVDLPGGADGHLARWCGPGHQRAERPRRSDRRGCPEPAHRPALGRVGDRAGWTLIRRALDACPSSKAVRPHRHAVGGHFYVTQRPLLRGHLW